jgi:hypothetical protein
MKFSFRLAGGLVASLALVGSTSAATSFQDHMDTCLAKYANPHDTALVMLECTAQDGKLSACKVVDNSAPNKGFDKAALCVAEALPMGSKVGDIKVPIRFSGS